jgi:Uma2 family endonuclease
VYSPSSRIYDRDFKRPTYLSLGVRETWMVDPRERTVTVSRPGTAETVVMDCLVWKPRECTAALELEVAGLFEGV